jgi:glycosyltransferase involved in cell wall biosynthesis
MAANSIDGIAECVKYFGVNNDNIVRLPNLVDPCEIDLKAALPLTIDWPAGYQVITIAARLDRMKRVDVLLEAVALLPRELPGCVIGVGDGTELNNLRKQAEELKISDRVKFPGWTDNPLPIIKHSSICVLCSEFEGFSNWVLEAMFVGIPVVTSFCSSDARAMCRTGAAVGFEPGDASTLAKQLGRLLNSSAAREALTKAAWQYCYSHEMSRAIPAYEQAILRAISNGNS